jgi:hypothetical protein
MAMADLDRDGDTDIILNGFWLETPANPRQGEFKQHTIAEKWFTQKSGTWQDNCASVAVGDINGDGLSNSSISNRRYAGLKRIRAARFQAEICRRKVANIG